MFGSVLLVIVGCVNLIYGIAAVANSHVFTANAHHVFGSLRTWGWVTLIIGVLQLLAAAGRRGRAVRAVRLRQPRQPDRPTPQREGHA